MTEQAREDIVKPSKLLWIFVQNCPQSRRDRLTGGACSSPSPEAALRSTILSATSMAALPCSTVPLVLNPSLASAWFLGGFLRVWGGEPDIAKRPNLVDESRLIALVAASH